MSIGENVAPLLGRVLIAQLFLIAALFKVEAWEWHANLVAQKGLPYAYAFVAIALIVETFCGLAILVGFRARMVAVVLFGYVLCVSYVMHDFWSAGTQTLYAQQLDQFLKNLAVAGGLLCIVGHGAGEWSIDSWRGE